MVLSIKAAAVAGYYFQENGLEACSELAAGRWIGSSDRFGVRYGARVTIDRLDHLLRRRTPKGEAPIFDPAQKSTGRDFVFSVPKALSVIWALSPKHVKAVIEQAQSRAVEAAVKVLLNEACRERLGKGGATLGKANAVGAAFLHVATRNARHEVFIAGKQVEEDFQDPNLHTHVVVPDVVEGARGRLKIGYTALHTHWSMALGAWYHATLAYELRRIGFRIAPRGPNGLFQILSNEPPETDASNASSAFPVEWIKAFSARTMSSPGDLTGADGPQGQERAALFLKHRPAFTKVDARKLNDQWKRYASGKRIDVSRFLPKRASTPSKVLKCDIDEMLVRAVEDISATDAVFQKQHLVRAVAARIVTDSLDVRPDLALIEELVKSDTVKGLAPSRAYGFEQWTTASTVARERSVISLTKKLSSVSGIPLPLADNANQSFQALTPEQQVIARRAISTERLIVVAGPPGTGKTHLLKPVVAAFQAQSGYRSVIGAAEAWQPALALHKEFGIPVYSLAQLFATEATGRALLRHDSVLIVDEAGLLPTKRMFEVLQLVEKTGAKLVLVGDPGQLNPIGAGSGMRLVEMATNAHRLSHLIRTTDVTHRQVAAGLISLREDSDSAPAPGKTFEGKQRVSLGKAHGSQSLETAKAIVDGLVANGRWKAFNSAESAIERIVNVLADEQLDSAKSASSTMAVVRSNREVQKISQELRKRLKAAGIVESEEISVPAVSPMGERVRLKMAEGDTIRFLVRRRNLGIYNGTRARVTKIQATGQSYRISVELNQEAKRRKVHFRLSEFANDEGRIRIASGYASTIYGCQGATVDQVIVLKNRRMEFRELYVAATRARRSCEIVEVSGSRATALQSERDVNAAKDAIARSIVTAARQDRPKQLAIDHQSDTRCAQRTLDDGRKTGWIWDTVIGGMGQDFKRPEPPSSAANAPLSS